MQPQLYCNIQYLMAKVLNNKDIKIKTGTSKELERPNNQY